MENLRRHTEPRVRLGAWCVPELRNAGIVFKGAVLSHHYPLQRSQVYRGFC